MKNMIIINNNIINELYLIKTQWSGGDGFLDYFENIFETTGFSDK